ncbi:MAG TPA: glycosyltransferase [Longimicrobiales bacterium]
MSAPKPFLSVIVPVYRGETVLRRSLPALLASDLPRSEWELVVVDDTSGDDTPAVAAEYADRIVRLDGGPRGPAYARNRGIEAARADIVVFIDADVCVHTDVLAKFAAAFRADAGLAAVFGSYDADPTAPGLVSQFRNLLHHHVHHLSPGPAETFWAGCGAVRREALLDVGMYDAWHFPRPQIEDIELGRRLRRAGYHIELRPDIQCTHLKRWTLRNMIVTDFRDRGVPWMWLLLSEGRSEGSAALNLRPSEKLCTALVAFIALALPAAALLRSFSLLLAAVLAVLIIVSLNRPFYAVLARARGPAFALACVPLHLTFYFTGGLGGVLGAALYYTRGVPGPPAPVPDEGAAPPPLDRPDSSVWAMAARGRR